LILLLSDAPLAGAPWTPELAERLQEAACVCACLFIGGFFATLRVALLHSVSVRVLARTSSERRRARIEPLLGRTESLATSAGVFEVTGEVLFAMLLLRFIADGAPIGWMSIVVTSLFAVPTLMILSEALPTAIALRRGDTLILAVLPVFNVVQMPLRWLVNALEAIRRALMRVVGLRQNPSASRQIVEGLREVIADAELSGDLDETEREIISNVMEFRDVNVSAVMTPRTKIRGVEIGDGLLAAARAASDSGHSRIPVYEGSLDTVVGVVTARDVVEVAAERGLEGASLRPILRPAHFVPETKRVSELLNEFRREKIKLAIVLDEYGGTAGLVTLGDIITEIVGHMQDEFDVDVREPVRRLPGGGAEVDAGLHVSEVNEELQLQIPEGEDFETLAGFVLSELGHFPQRGERFVLGATEYTVLEASDRRVLKVGIRPLPQEVAS
jgi:CBS domain containing-hemolysin-like protein